MSVKDVKSVVKFSQKLVFNPVFVSLAALVAIKALRTKPEVKKAAGSGKTVAVMAPGAKGKVAAKSPSFTAQLKRAAQLVIWTASALFLAKKGATYYKKGFSAQRISQMALATLAQMKAAFSKHPAQQEVSSYQAASKTADPNTSSYQAASKTADPNASSNSSTASSTKRAPSGAASSIEEPAAQQNIPEASDEKPSSSSTGPKGNGSSMSGRITDRPVDTGTAAKTGRSALEALRAASTEHRTPDGVPFRLPPAINLPVQRPPVSHIDTGVGTEKRPPVSNIDTGVGPRLPQTPASVDESDESDAAVEVTESKEVTRLRGILKKLGPNPAPVRFVNQRNLCFWHAYLQTTFHQAIIHGDLLSHWSTLPEQAKEVATTYIKLLKKTAQDPTKGFVFKCPILGLNEGRQEDLAQVHTLFHPVSSLFMANARHIEDDALLTGIFAQGRTHQLFAKLAAYFEQHSKESFTLCVGAGRFLINGANLSDDAILTQIKEAIKEAPEAITFEGHVPRVDRSTFSFMPLHELFTSSLGQNRSLPLLGTPDGRALLATLMDDKTSLTLSFRTGLPKKFQSNNALLMRALTAYKGTSNSKALLTYCANHLDKTFSLTIDGEKFPITLESLQNDTVLACIQSRLRGADPSSLIFTGEVPTLEERGGSLVFTDRLMGRLPNREKEVTLTKAKLSATPIASDLAIFVTQLHMAAANRIPYKDFAIRLKEANNLPLPTAQPEEVITFERMHHDQLLPTDIELEDPSSFIHVGRGHFEDVVTRNAIKPYINTSLVTDNRALDVKRADNSVTPEDLLGIKATSQATKDPRVWQLVTGPHVLMQAQVFDIDEGRLVARPEHKMVIPKRSFDAFGRHFELESFAKHQGSSIHGGHWMAYRKIGDQWWELDDCRGNTRKASAEIDAILANNGKGYQLQHTFYSNQPAT